MNESNRNRLPVFLNPVHAGFPSPADDLIEDFLNLNEFLITHPAGTFFLRVKGESMINAGIYNNDILIVDRTLTPGNNTVVVASIQGSFTVKYLIRDKEKKYLAPANPLFKPIDISENSEFAIWGVVTYNIHKL